MDSSPEGNEFRRSDCRARDQIGACHAVSAWPIAVLSIAGKWLEQPGRTRDGRTRPVSDARAQQVANDPVTNLFRERSKATAPGLAKEVWVGVDTHKEVNVAAAVDESGRTIGGDQPASISAPTTPEGNSDLLAWARGLGETVVAFAVEGTGSYGASLTRFLQGKGQIVVEATRPKREDKAVRRTLGKSDAIDALLAAQRLHRLELRISPKSRVGDVECLRMLRIARKTAVKARVQALNSMKALIVTAPDDLREQLRGLTKDTLPDKCASLRPKGTGRGGKGRTAQPR